MQNIAFLIFRRMRRPLLTLVLAYSVAVLGLVLIPGQDDAGNPWSMDFLHAFYIVTYTSTTIGFGEIPYEFTNAQRLWMIYTVYSTVVVWFYAIGNILALVQDPAFKQAMTERRFTRQIRHLREPFYLICGYGETGSALVRSLTERHQHAVVIDIDQERINLIRLDNLREYVPVLCADASLPVHLLEAGLQHPRCLAVVALTNINEVNLKIAITSKLLRPGIKVICRADSHDVEANMDSFGTDHIIDPYDTFAQHLAVALQVPGLYLLHEWLTGVRHQPLTDPVHPPVSGQWIVCGFGRFGQAVYNSLSKEGLRPVVVEATPEKTGAPEEGCIVGRGTEAATLVEAGIDQAAGLVAGTDDDANNLSIIMTARILQKNLFVVARQNQEMNEPIFDAIEADMVMHPSAIIANKIRVLLGTPLLYEFMSLAKHQDDAWACELVSRVVALVDKEVPEVWELALSEEQAYAVHQVLGAGRVITLAHIVSDAAQRQRSLPCIVLLMLRNNTRTILPNPETPMKRGDKLLVCGRLSALSRMRWTLQNDHALNYIVSGEDRPQGWVWQLLYRRFGGASSDKQEERRAEDS
jgi:Trk K+ transport system NAD-binding subunit